MTGKIYVDMVGDLFHAGHVDLLKQAKALGDWLMVGVLSDETAIGYKRQPVMTLAERVAVVESCRYVDEVFPDAPNVVTTSFLDEHNIDLVVHGDDLSKEAIAAVYADVERTGKLHLIKQKADISTTKLLQRIEQRHRD